MDDARSGEKRKRKRKHGSTNGSEGNGVKEVMVREKKDKKVDEADRKEKKEKKSKKRPAEEIEEEEEGEEEREEEVLDMEESSRLTNGNDETESGSENEDGDKDEDGGDADENTELETPKKNPEDIPAVNTLSLPQTGEVPKLFSELKLSENTMKGIQDMGFTTMTEVQARTIPPCMSGRDVSFKYAFLSLE